MFRALSEFIPKAVNKMAVARQITAAHVCEAFRKIAPAIIHEEVLSYAEPRYFKQGVLMIAVENSAWAQVITDKKEALLDALELRLQSTAVKNIKTSIGARPEPEENAALGLT